MSFIVARCAPKVSIASVFPVGKLKNRTELIYGCPLWVDSVSMLIVITLKVRVTTQIFRLCLGYPSCQSWVGKETNPEHPPIP